MYTVEIKLSECLKEMVTHDACGVPTQGADGKNINTILTPN